MTQQPHLQEPQKRHKCILRAQFDRRDKGNGPFRESFSGQQCFRGGCLTQIGDAVFNVSSHGKNRLNRISQQAPASQAGRVAKRSAVSLVSMSIFAVLSRQIRIAWEEQGPNLFRSTSVLLLSGARVRSSGCALLWDVGPTDFVLGSFAFGWHLLAIVCFLVGDKKNPTSCQRWTWR